MADEKKKIELDAKTQDPTFMYHLTQKYMKDYVMSRGTKEDQIWYCKLVLANKKKVKSSICKCIKLFTNSTIIYGINI